MILFLKNLLFTVFIPGTVAVYLPLRIAGIGRAPLAVPAWAWLAAVPLLAAGTVLYFWCLWNFAVVGKGTPAPIDPPKKLVVRGPHRHVRNPMYLAVLSIASGWAVLFRSSDVLLYVACVAVVFHLVVLLLEEPVLREQFGAEYRAYCQAVRRWIPGPGFHPGEP
jgi:protein-S-isoprenylcysteine O-methyltransferase Ste14